MEEDKTSHRRKRHWNGQLQPCKRGAEIPLAHINQHAWAEGQLVESPAVALQARFCLRAARAEVPHLRWERVLGSMFDFRQGHKAF
jgi:hypothetical protein